MWDIKKTTVWLCSSISLSLGICGMLYAAVDFNGVLLYSGLTENGWQIFAYDLEKSEELQLSSSLGDKRSPQYLDFRNEVICRFVDGSLHKVNSSGEPLYDSSWGACADFSIATDGTIGYFSRLGSGSIPRQFLWKQRAGSENSELFRRMDSGSLRYSALSPDGGMLAATHLSRRNEERLVVFDTTRTDDFAYLTENNTFASFPTWTADGSSIIFVLRVGEQNYDLYEVNLPGRELRPLLATEQTSEFSPTADGSNRFIYFETRTADGCSLACLERKSGKVTPIKLPRQAKEPFWCMPSVPLKRNGGKP